MKENDRYFFLICLMVYLMVFLVSCSHVEQKTYSKNDADLVTVATALTLAQAAYVRGCVEQAHEQNEKKIIDTCVLKAKNYIQKDVVFILDQEPIKLELK